MTKRTVFLAAAALAGALQALPASAAVDCDGPVNFVDAKACDAARHGIDALRQFVWRTRMIYALYLPDYLHAVRR
jgi:hypothetical protein